MRSRAVRGYQVGFCVVLLLVRCYCATVYAPLRVSVIFAGSLPLFLRDEQWKGDLGVNSSLSESLAFAAQEERSKPESSSSEFEGSLSFDYSFDVHFASSEQSEALGEVLTKSLDMSKTLLLPAVEIAEKYVKILSPLLGLLQAQGKESHDHVFLLLHDPINLVGNAGFNYGFVAGRDGNVVESGLAQGTRFLFLDTAARPHIFGSSNGPSTGERLISASSDISAYARELGHVVRDLVTPRRSTQMMSLPAESTLVFKLIQINMTDIVRIMQGRSHQGGKSRTTSIGTSFDAEQFERLIANAFEHHNWTARIKVERHNLDSSKEVDIAMAAFRAFRQNGLHLMLDSDILIRDLVQQPVSSGETILSFYSDVSFVAHIPILLFSFADQSRVAHFSDGEAVRASVLGGEAIGILENRLKNEVEDRQDITALAVKGVLQLFGGLGDDTLSLLDTSRSSVAVFVKDVMRRHIVSNELAWSHEVAVKPAEDLLRFDGHDISHIPHGEETELGAALKNMRSVLDATLQAWNVAAVDHDLALLDELTPRLESSITTSRNALYDAICSRSLENFQNGGRAQVGFIENLQFLFHFVLLPGLLGSLLAYLTLDMFSDRSSSRRRRQRNLDFDYNVDNGPVWFSTLSEKFIARRKKPKLN